MDAILKELGYSNINTMTGEDRRLVAWVKAVREQNEREKFGKRTSK